MDDSPDSPSWETAWTSRGTTSIYAYGGVVGVVALARYAHEFYEIDDPDAHDYGGHFVAVDIGDIAMFRNDAGHVLRKVVAIEPTPTHRGIGHVSVTIRWEIRLASTTPGVVA